MLKLNKRLLQWMCITAYHRLEASISKTSLLDVFELSIDSPLSTNDILPDPSEQENFNVEETATGYTEFYKQFFAIKKIALEPSILIQLDQEILFVPIPTDCFRPAIQSLMLELYTTTFLVYYKKECGKLGRVLSTSSLSPSLASTETDLAFYNVQRFLQEIPSDTPITHDRISLVRLLHFEKLLIGFKHFCKRDGAGGYISFIEKYSVLEKACLYPKGKRKYVALPLIHFMDFEDTSTAEEKPVPKAQLKSYMNFYHKYLDKDSEYGVDLGGLKEKIDIQMNSGNILISVFIEAQEFVLEKLYTNWLPRFINFGMKIELEPLSPGLVMQKTPLPKSKLSAIVQKIIPQSFVEKKVISQSFLEKKVAANKSASRLDIGAGKSATSFLISNHRLHSSENGSKTTSQLDLREKLKDVTYDAESFIKVLMNPELYLVFRDFVEVYQLLHTYLITH